MTTYQNLVQKMKTTPSMETWQEIENLKNQNGGMPPCEHTPGPWQHSTHWGWEKVYPVGDGRPVAQVCACHSPQEERANARLIAAAPDLLAALEQAVDVLWLTGDRFNDHKAAVTDAARAAIQKAKGQQ